MHMNSLQYIIPPEFSDVVYKSLHQKRWGNLIRDAHLKNYEKYIGRQSYPDNPHPLVL